MQKKRTKKQKKGKDEKVGGKNIFLSFFFAVQK